MTWLACCAIVACGILHAAAAPISESSAPEAASSPAVVADAEASKTPEQELLIPENTSLWTEADLWSTDLELRAGFGYKDNVLLSPSNPRGSALFASGIDLLISRLPLDGLLFNFYLTGTDTRYLGNVGIDGEDVFAANIQVQKAFAGDWKVGLVVGDIYVDQVQYVFEAVGPRRARARGNIINGRPYLRRELGSDWWVELSSPFERDLMDEPLDNSWVYGVRLGLGRNYGVASRAGFTYSWSDQRHDSWQALTSTGKGLPKTLAIQEHRWELWDEHYWDQKKRWRSATRLGFRYKEDNGGGFYDRYEYLVSEEIRFKTQVWEIKANAGISYQDFLEQRVIPLDPASPKLYRTPLSVGLEVNRRLYKFLHVYARYEFEKTTSNLGSSEYQVNTIMGGLSAAF